MNVSEFLTFGALSTAKNAYRDIGVRVKHDCKDDIQGCISVA